MSVKVLHIGVTQKINVNGVGCMLVDHVVIIWKRKITLLKYIKSTCLEEGMRFTGSKKMLPSKKSADIQTLDVGAEEGLRGLV